MAGRVIMGGRPAPRVPDGTRAYVVGDIHGRVDLLQRLLERIVADGLEHADSQKYLIFLGDYIDRGPWTKGVLDLLTGTAPVGFHCVYLKGNHEAAMLGFLYNEAHGPHWLALGAAATLGSYGVVQVPGLGGRDLIRQFQRGLHDAVPDRHALFLSSLGVSFTLGDYFFVHAGVRPGLPLDRQRETDLLTIREEFLSSDRWHGKCVVHGHTISKVPVVWPNRIGIDTGAYATGRLSCLVLEGTRQSFLVGLDAAAAAVGG